jgi:hypothetical protein
MNVRWMAVLTGFVVDIAISALLSLLATPQFYTAPNLAQPGDLLLIGLLALSTGIGGFVAGRMAGESRTINGLLVAIVGILVNQLGPPLPRVFVIFWSNGTASWFRRPSARATGIPQPPRGSVLQHSPQVR